MPVSRRRSTAIEDRRAAPVTHPRPGIDHGEEPASSRHRPAAQDVHEVSASKREDLTNPGRIFSQPIVRRGSGEHEHAAEDGLRSPPERCGSAWGFAHVPAQLPLKPSEIHQFGFHLDNE